MKKEKIYEIILERGYFTAEDLYSYILDAYKLYPKSKLTKKVGSSTDPSKSFDKAGISLKTIQNWLLKVPRIEENKKPLRYRVEWWHEVLSEHSKKLKALENKQNANFKQAKFKRKLAAEQKEQEDLRLQIPSDYDQGDFQFDADVNHDAEVHFKQDQIVFMLKEILNELGDLRVNNGDSKKKLDEKRLFADEKLYAYYYLSNVAMEDRTYEQDEVLKRLKDYRNYFIDTE
ncbi:hypothetical protein EFM54_08570 [Lentilactobacillus buchneri]|uniref:hypothetical protein n=1 Tax=Lentilactobacillus buchneri TaxID=1581 RepID=UPI0021A92190|nr:hypothetical protein [Lentilactobacillus buchneri]MCT2899029.1 hypothetical protein [Lentilactobacillus buchneri]